jgi:hypothetical protein
MRARLTGSGTNSHVQSRAAQEMGGCIREREPGGCFMKQFAVYRTESGTVFRVQHSEDGFLSVELLKAGAWQPAPIGMVGLRTVVGTKRLTERQIDALVD